MPSRPPMTESGIPRRVARFAAFEFDLGTGELRKHELRIKLKGQPIDVLTMLIEHAGELVTREELQKRLWAADTSLVTLHGVAALFGFIAGVREKQLIAFTLMVAFAVIMRTALGQDS